MTMASRLVRAALLALAVAAPLGRGVAQPAPYHHYRTLDTPHFRVSVAAGLEREGRVAAAAAERAYEQLGRELERPRGIVDLIVTDDADYSNGFATPLPTNRIVVFASPPVDAGGGLRFNEDWLALVVTHELTHIFHLDRARGIWNVAQHVFGRAPFLFPNLYGPSWLTEGLAVYYESRLTEGGRLKDSRERLLARASATEGRLPHLNELSLGSPRFPGGEGAYAYGAMFIDYLARTRGDTAVRNFIERQSAQLIPFWIDRAAVQGFGISFARAFDEWRDSVQRSVAAPRPPLPGWRELTTHGYYASAPRWLNDSTIVYVGTDGRETNAAYTVTTSGVRTRLGRRDGRGANVPLPDGSLLYAALDFTAPEEVRSDLYRSYPDGRVVRLTHGARLTQPDVRRDGMIVAVRLAPARSSLVLVSPAGTLLTELDAAGPDETWTEPRWSPNGEEIAVVRRLHGGIFSLDVVRPSAPGHRNVLDRGRYVISAPSWMPDGTRIVYVSEEGGNPHLAFANSRWTDSVYTPPPGYLAAPPVFTPDVSPNGERLAAVTLRADGYHVGVAETPLRNASQLPALTRSTWWITAMADSQSLAPGDYHDYSAWRTVLPRYWYPLAEAAPAHGVAVGAMTSGSDAIGRHLYSAYGAVQTDGRFAVGGIFYRYAGLRRPLVDLSLSQGWTSLGSLVDASRAPVGTLLKRTQDLSLAATFVRPRVRTYSSMSAGLGVERRSFATDPAPLLARIDPTFAGQYTFPRAFLGGIWTNAQRPALSVSPEDGVALAFTARERLRSDAPSRTASASVVATAAGYKSLDLPGFAHHVLALRLAGGVADRRAGTSLEVGGTSGTTLEIVPGYTVGEGRRTFGVRGFPAGSVYGTRAAAATLEYRAPLMLGGRGLGPLPFFFDRSSLTAFADAGVAGCAADPLYPSICVPSPLIGRTIASTGAELVLSAAVLEWDTPQSIRVGVALQVVGREMVGARPASAYVAFGLSF
jgi:hypothetical protein